MSEGSAPAQRGDRGHGLNYFGHMKWSRGFILGTEVGTLDAKYILIFR